MVLEISLDEDMASAFHSGPQPTQRHTSWSFLVRLKAWIKGISWGSALVLVDLHLKQSPELQQDTWKGVKEVKPFRFSPSAASHKCSSCGWGNYASVTGWNEGVCHRWRSCEVKDDGVAMKWWSRRFPCWEIPMCAWKKIIFVLWEENSLSSNFWGN